MDCDTGCPETPPPYAAADNPPTYSATSSSIEDGTQPDSVPYFGYFIASAYLENIFRVGHIVSAVDGDDPVVLLRLDQTTSSPKLYATGRKREWPNRNITVTRGTNEPNGLAGCFRLSHSITRMSFGVEGLTTSECELDAEFVEAVEEEQCIADTLREAPSQQAFLVYGVAQAASVRVQRSTSERRGCRLGLSFLSFGTSRFGALKLTLNRGKVRVEDYNAGAHF